MKVLLVRHAPPELPTARASQAADNGRPLTQEGRLAAQALAEQLEAYLFVRCIQVPTDVRAKRLSRLPGGEVCASQWWMAFGSVALSTSVLEHSAFLEAVTRARNDRAFALAGGESAAEVETRAWAGLERIRRGVDDGIAVAGAHGGLTSILRWSLGEDFTVEDALAVPTPAVFP